MNGWGGFAFCVLHVGKMFNQAFEEISKVWGKQNEGRETFGKFSRIWSEDLRDHKLLEG